MRPLRALTIPLAVVLLTAPAVGFADSLDDARKELATAEERALAANTAYGEMKIQNYPRGEKRRLIVEERIEARAEVERMRARVAQLEAEAR